MKNLLFTTKSYSIDLGLLILRITFGGLMFINHGLGKIEKLQQHPVKFMDFMGIGQDASLWLVVFAEAVCTLLLVLGFATRLALIPLIITMLVATFKANAGQPFSEIELPLLYLLPFIALLFTGPGKYSIDRLIESRM